MYLCQWFVLCENVVHDTTTGCLSMVNALFEIRASRFPALHPRFAFAAVLARSDGSTGPMSFRFVREAESGGETVAQFIGVEGAPRLQFYVNFPVGVRLMGIGPISFRIDVQEGGGDWCPVGRQVIQVLDLAPPE